MDTNCKLDICLQWQSHRQHLEDEVCRLEKEVTSLEEVKRDLDSRIIVSDQTLQSHNAVIADLRLQLDNTNMEKVGNGMCCWTSEPRRCVCVGVVGGVVVVLVLLLLLLFAHCVVKWIPLKMEGSLE